ncbi:Fc.00g024900.m01.CDS01 [Cosmosporella sp. VM-42]
MVLSVEVTSKVGVSKDNVEYGSFRKWLTPISAQATIHPDESEPPVEVGKALGFIIRRVVIQSAFHETMETPHQGTMDLALDLFDRYGRLKEEIHQHALRKGSGVWKTELDDGNLVLIENIEVERKYRRKGVGSKLVLHILEQAMRSQYNVAYAFAGAAAYLNDDGGAGNAGPSNAPHHAKVEGVESFLRSLQFRRVGLTSWLALARDSEHPSRRLARDKDPDPKLEIDDLIDSDSDEEVIQCNANFTQTRFRKSEWDARWLGVSPRQKPAITSRNRPLHYAVKTLPDKDALTFLKSHTRDGVLEEFPLDALDGRGDTVLHVAAKSSKPRCVAWLLRQPINATFTKANNYAGYTPVEALQAQLEICRVQTPYGLGRMQLVADQFDGFDDDSVTCLLLLQGVKEPSPEQRMGAKLGCSCSECLGGFLSPRMLIKLSEQAQMQHQYLTNLTPPGNKAWYTEFKDLLDRVPESFRSRVRGSKVLQAAFVSLMGAVVACLSEGKIPRKAAVVEYLQATETWAPIESQYFAQGGTVAVIVGAVFDKAMLHDLEVGDAMIEAEPEEYYKGSPKCRNDLEFEFARRHCADDATPVKETEKPLPVPIPWVAEVTRLVLEGKDPFQHMGI